MAWASHGRSSCALLACAITAGTLNSVVIAIAVVLLIEVLAGHQPVPALMFFGLATIVASTAAATQAFGLWLLFQLGGWTRRGGRLVRRAEQPLRFWTWTAGSSIILAVWLTVAGFLLWTMLSSLSQTPN
jgi:hypothetical protein